MRKPHKKRPIIASAEYVEIESYKRPFIAYIFAEVFLRRKMGSKYFTKRIFIRGLFYLGLLRALPALIPVKYSLVMNSPLELSWFDMFIIGFTLASLYQFYGQYKSWARNETAHKYHIGDSRLLYFGKIVSPIKDYQYITYQYIEPLLILILSVLVYFYLDKVWAGFVFFIALSMWQYPSKIFEGDPGDVIIIHDGKHKTKLNRLNDQSEK